MIRVSRVARFSLTSADPASLVEFYREALGFTPLGIKTADASRYGIAHGRASVHRLRLGAQEIELVGFDVSGAPYPPGSTGHDQWFQHLALVTVDIEAAYARLSSNAGWRPITTGGGPVALPPSSGGVTAFKFRDPEGHPLEFLAFPSGRMPAHWAQIRQPGPCIGIDHSAIVVANGARSIAFYEALGLTISAKSLNQGPAQQRLDAAPDVHVAVTGLATQDAPPHIELLAYRAPAVRPGTTAPNDIACTRSVMRPEDPADAGQTLEDPDGHRIMLD